MSHYWQALIVSQNFLKTNVERDKERMSGDMCNILYTFQLSSVFMNKIPQETHEL